MFSSIRGRLWLSYAAVIATALTIVSLVVTVFLLRNPYTYRQAALRLASADSLLPRNPSSPSEVEAVAEALDVRVLQLAPDGGVMSDTAPTEAPLRLPAPGRRVRSVLAARDSDGRAWLYMRKQLADSSWLVVATRRPGILPILEVLRDDVWRPMIQGALLALLLALILAYLLARWIADPLQHLIMAARSVAARTGRPVDAHGGETHPNGTGELPGAGQHGPKEVRELTKAFSDMLERVRASQRSQKEFVASVSHELRTPLTSIQGFSQAIIDGTADSPDERRRAAEIIHREAGRMSRMAAELLDLARLDAGTAEPSRASVDLRSLLGDLAQRFQPLAATAGVALSFSVPADLPAMLGDGDKLNQVFSNLIDNALKFTPRGGEVRVAAKSNVQEVRISVSDSGPGIAAADLEHVFDRFYQADAARGGGTSHGAGLGLAIAREMVQAHGGKITLRSVLGQGAEFEVHLPRLEGSRDKHGAA